jgi:hypothetical protein
VENGHRSSQRRLRLYDASKFRNFKQHLKAVEEDVLIAREEFEKNPKLRGDTTGCGDNFVGGAIASVALQMTNKIHKLSLTELAVLGTVCGGFACYYTGGTYFEKYSGEKMEKINGLLQKYVN